MISEKVSEYRNMMVECFSTDPELLEKYHIVAGSGIDSCVDRTCADLQDAKVEVYVLKNNTDTIGYYGIEGQFLSGFFLKPQYRTSNSVKEFWSEVESRFNGDFYVGVYNKNQRAIDFLLKKTDKFIDVPNLGKCFVITKENSTCR